MKVQILDTAEEDLVEGYWFYQRQQPGLGAHFRNGIYADLYALEKTAGVHRIVYKNYHRALATRFPFALYYSVSGQTAFVRAIVDCRRNPTWISEHLR
jgi:hypothetical protein